MEEWADGESNQAMFPNGNRKGLKILIGTGVESEGPRLEKCHG
jgi:hypothetical protein